MSITKTFTIEKETPGTFQYKEAKDDTPVVSGTLYIKKAVLPKKAPKTIKVTFDLGD